MSVVLYALDEGYVAAFDPDWQPPGYDGPQVGRATFTSDPAEALQFTDVAAAMDFWKKPSTRRPLRSDGKPNRPLTAYTVEVRPAPKDQP